MRHLRRLADTVDRNAQRAALIDANGERTLTYSETHRLATNVASELRRRGVQRGDRLAVSIPNSLELALCYLAALYAGVVIVPLGSGFGRRELRSILARARPRYVLSAPGDGSSRINEVAEEAGLEVLTVGAEGSAGELDALTADPPRDGWEPFDGMSSEALVSIHFTSGTTGTPRGVGHSLRDFVANADRFAGAVGLDGTHTFHASLPMTYMAGYYNLLLLPLTLGAGVVIDRAFDARSLITYWEAPIRYSADVLWLVPTIMAMLLRMDRGDEGKEYCREKVRFVACGTAPLDPALRLEFEETYGVPVHESYGLSETLLATSSTPVRPASPGSIGAPLPGVEVQTRGPDGTALEPGATGTVFLSSPDIMLGYLEENGSEPSFRSGLVEGRWLDTGDIGVVDSGGELRITGRSKELIIRGGVNVSPVAIERVLEGHELVEGLAVVGVPHDLLGEEIAVVVVCRDGKSLTELEESLRGRAKEQLEAGQQPGMYLQIDELPTTPTGKVRKAALRDLVIDRLGLPEPSKGFAVDAGEGGASAERTDVAGWRGGGRMVDLSYEIREGMTTYPSPNHPRTELTVLARHHLEGRATRRLVLGTHTGTHLDAPLHFLPDGDGTDQLSLSALVGPASIVNLAPVEPLQEIGLARLQGAIGSSLQHPRMLLRFDWTSRWESLDFYAQSPFLSQEACEWLVDQNVTLLGMDTPSPDDPRNGFGSGNDSPNHKILLGAGIVLLEYLTNLDQVRADEVFLMALPLRLAGADGAPARVVALDQSG